MSLESASCGRLDRDREDGRMMGEGGGCRQDRTTCLLRVRLQFLLETGWTVDHLVRVVPTSLEVSAPQSLLPFLLCSHFTFLTFHSFVSLYYPDVPSFQLIFLVGLSPRLFILAGFCLSLFLFFSLSLSVCLFLCILIPLSLLISFIHNPHTHSLISRISLLVTNL